MMKISVLGSAVLIAVGLGIGAAAAGEPPPQPVPRAQVAHELHLTRAQQSDIRGIIGENRRAGLPTIATRRAVLRVLTPAQRDSLVRLVPPQSNPR